MARADLAKLTPTQLISLDWALEIELAGRMVCPTYYGVSDIEIAMDLDKRATCSKPPLKVSWWARTFGCALWHLHRYGFRSWLIWELQHRPRGKGPFDLIGKNEGCPLYTCPLKGVPKVVQCSKYTLWGEKR